MPFLLLVAFGCFTTSITLRMIDPLIPEIARDLDSPVAAVTLLTSAYAFPYALGQPFFGALGDSLGKALVIKTCLTILAVLLGLCALAPSLDALMGLRIVAGLVAGGIVPLSYAMIADRTPAPERPTALARLMMAGFLAQIFGLVGAGVVGGELGWRAAVGASAALVGVAAVVFLFKLKPRANVTRAPLTLTGALAAYPMILRRPRALICYGGAAIEGMCFFGVTPFISILMEKQGTGGAREAGYALAALGIGGIVFALGINHILRGVGGAANMTRLGGVLSLVGFSSVAAAATWPQYGAALLVAGLGFYMTHNALVARVTELAPENRGACMSLFAFSFFTGQAAGPPLFALGLATVGPVATFGAVGALLLALSLVAAATLPPKAASVR